MRWQMFYQTMAMAANPAARCHPVALSARRPWQDAAVCGSRL